MPIATNERGKILRYLNLSVLEKPVIDVLCDNLEAISEQLAQQVNELVAQLDSNSEEIRKASTGMVKLDVIEWKENRKCDLYSYRSQLIRQLANAIGYQLTVIKPW